MKSKISFLVTFLSTLIASVKAQQPIKFQTEAGVFLSTSGQNPFWIRSNQYGIVPLESQFLTLRGYAHKEYDSTITSVNKLKKFGFGYGGGVVANIGKVNQLLLPEAYVKARFGAFEIYGGRRKEIVGLVDTTLTSGSYIWSGNALPLPKIQISIPNYTSIIGNGLISIKGSYAHGWFGTEGETKNFYLHQKTLYGRIGKPHWKMKFYGGFNHQVQWGGKPLKPYIESETGKLITNYGNDLATYWNVVSGISLNTKGGIDIPGIPANDAWNRSGNHLGSIDLAAEVNLKKVDLLIYRQSIYDDGSLYYLNNISDGLLGISVKRKNVTNGLLGINFEYLNTTNQGGEAGSDNIIPELRGRDNYFNNSFYGWIYQKNIIGTPYATNIIPLKTSLYSNYDILLKTLPSNFIINNRIKSYYINIHYKYRKVVLLSRISSSNNLGIYGNVIDVKQISIMTCIQVPVNKCVVKGIVSYDTNGLFKKSLGSYLSINRFF